MIGELILLRVRDNWQDELPVASAGRQRTPMEANRVLAVVALQDAITDAACGREVPCAADIVMRLEEAGWRITRVAMRGIDIEGHK